MRAIAFEKTLINALTFGYTFEIGMVAITNNKTKATVNVTIGIRNLKRRKKPCKINLVPLFSKSNWLRFMYEVSIFN